MPPGKVGTRDVSDLSRADKVIERAQSLLDRSIAIKTMHVINVDIVCAKAAQTIFACFGDVIARRSDIVYTLPYRESSFCRDEHLITNALNSLAKNLFSETI